MSDRNIHTIEEGCSSSSDSTSSDHPNDSASPRYQNERVSRLCYSPKTVKLIQKVHNLSQATELR